MHKDNLNELNELELGGVMAYTPLMFRLKECGDDVDKRMETILHRLPVALLCALQNEECLQDIKNVGEKYPELLPVIFSCAMGLRSDKRLKEWTKYESADYKDFISGIGNRIRSGGVI